MPKKKKAGKNKKNSHTNVEKRKLVESDLDGQIYGFIEKALGSRFFTVNCMDNTKRRCKVRKKRMRCKEGDCVIVSLRDFDDENADVIYKYDVEEVRQLQKMGVIPTSDVVGAIGAIDEDMMDDDGGFTFEEI